jgi:tetratricopeptide (TPR) repeat protein
MTATVVTTRVGRNDHCPCGSGKKFKKCCEGKDARADMFYAGGWEPQPGGGKLQALARAGKEYWAAEGYADAVTCYRELTRLQPTRAEAHYDLGLALARCGRLSEAASSLEYAIKLKPSFTQALTQLAHVFEMGGKESDALEVYRRLRRLTDGPLDRLYYAAKTLAMEGRLYEAEEKLRRLVAVAPGFAPARLAYGQLLLDRGKFAEAEPEFVIALESIPSAFEKLAQVRQMTESDRPMIERVLTAVADARLDVESRVAIEFGLGKAFGDLREHGESMRHYDEANSLRARTARLDRPSLVDRYDRLIARYDRGTLERAAQELARPARADDELPVFIVGMPRSGTTLTEQILSAHPKVAAAGELPFWKGRLREWGRGTTDPAAGALLSTVTEYCDLLRSYGPEVARVTDKAPLNFELLWLIRLAFPNARIIHCRRNPINTGLSIYFSYFWAHQTYAFDKSDIVFFYRHYERLMAHWRSVLPPERFTEGDYETLVAEPEAESRRLIDFLGLPWDDACLAPENNVRSVKTASVWQARQPVYKTSVERWRRYEPWLGELRELLSEPDAAPS